ncbi:uncharacterized protein [Anabrus simplex]|uniref:uncharacterized protein n=1 Tax=Anabrus simplex TaxID=316456 RepID=UPI0035A2FD3F
MVGVVIQWCERDPQKLSALEKQLKSLKFVDYMNSLKEKRREMRKEYEKRRRSPPPEGNHHRCNTFWYKRIRVDQPSMTASDKYKDEYMLRKEREEEHLKEKALRIHDKPMQFPRVKYDDGHLRMDHKTVQQQESLHSIHTEGFKTTFKPIKFFDEVEKPDVGGPFLPPPESKTAAGLKTASLNCNVKIRKHFNRANDLFNRETSEENLPRFLVVSRVNGQSFLPENLFIISNAVEDIVGGEVDEMRKLRDGSVLIKTTTVVQSKRLLEATMFGPVPVKV